MANSRPTPKLLSTVRIPKPNVQAVTLASGPAYAPSVKARTKLSNPTPTYHPAASCSPEGLTKLPRPLGEDTTPVSVSVRVWSCASHCKLELYISPLEPSRVRIEPSCGSVETGTRSSTTFCCRSVLLNSSERGITSHPGTCTGTPWL